MSDWDDIEQEARRRGIEIRSLGETVPRDLDREALDLIIRLSYRIGVLEAALRTIVKEDSRFTGSGDQRRTYGYFGALAQKGLELATPAKENDA